MALVAHTVLLNAMLAKFAPEILDFLDVFIMEVEELFVPFVSFVEPAYYVIYWKRASIMA